MKGKRLLMLAMLVAPLFLSGCFLDELMGGMVNQDPTAVIDAAPMEGFAPLAVTLDAHYSHDDDGDIVEYHWDFGDRSSPMGVSDNPTCEYTYTRPGTYIVRLSVIDDEGAAHWQQVAIVVTNGPPTAVANVSNPGPYPGETIVFSAEGSQDYEGEIVKYVWDFGDKTMQAEGATTSHSYIKGGYYVVTLTVFDKDGLSDSVKLNVHVLPGSSNCGGSSGDSCGSDNNVVVSFDASPSATSSCSSVPAGTVITFTAYVNSEDPITIDTYTWEFGDGAIGTGKTASHAYTKSGVYILKVHVRDTAGGVHSNNGYPIHIDSAATCP